MSIDIQLRFGLGAGSATLRPVHPTDPLGTEFPLWYPARPNSEYRNSKWAVVAQSTTTRDSHYPQA